MWAKLHLTIAGVWGARHLSDEAFHDVQLHCIGSVRGADDRALLHELQELARQLGIEEAVQWRVNVPWAELQAALGSAYMGLHTMWNEHFGIGVVEMLAAGVVTIAHHSGGPQTDIVQPAGAAGVGFLADTPQGYAQAMAAVLRGQVDVPKLVQRARAHVQQFSDEAFEARMKPLVDALLQK